MFQNDIFKHVNLNRIHRYSKLSEELKIKGIKFKYKAFLFHLRKVEFN